MFVVLCYFLFAVVCVIKLSFVVINQVYTTTAYLKTSKTGTRLFLIFVSKICFIPNLKIQKLYFLNNFLNQGYQFFFQFKGHFNFTSIWSSHLLLNQFLTKKVN